MHEIFERMENTHVHFLIPVPADLPFHSLPDDSAETVLFSSFLLQLSDVLPVNNGDIMSGMSKIEQY